jgi:hypothetical protein
VIHFLFHLQRGALSFPLLSSAMAQGKERDSFASIYNRRLSKSADLNVEAGFVGDGYRFSLPNGDR